VHVSGQIGIDAAIATLGERMRVLQRS